MNKIDLSDIGNIALMIGTAGLAFAAVGVFYLPILLGSAAVAAMGVSLLIFSFALSKISESVNNIDLSEIGSIALMIAAVGIATAVVGAFYIPILLGSLALVAMSVSLLIFSFTLSKLSESVKNVSLLDMGVAALSIVMLGAAVAAVGVFSIFILPGSLALAIMNATLTKFSKTLETVSKVGRELKFSDITYFCLAMAELGAAISLGAASYPFVSIGAKTIKAMNNVLTPFINILTAISKIKNPKDEIEKITTGLNILKDFFKENILESKAVNNAERYVDLLKPFDQTVRHFAKLQDIGEIPLSLVRTTLKAMKLVAYYYILNPIEKSTIKQAERYKEILEPFGQTVVHFAKLQEIGEIPLSLVTNTLKAMKLVAYYYILNPIEKDAIKQAERYKEILEPFGETVANFAKLQEIGEIPLSLVTNTLDAMKSVAYYYILNPIEKEAIKQAERYKNILNPFGETLKYFAELNEMKNIPIHLVLRTLKAMKLISSFYIKNPIEKDGIKQAKRYKDVLDTFGKTLEHFTKLNEIGNISIELVGRTLGVMKAVASFYINNPIEKDVIEQAKRYKNVLEHMASTMVIISNVNVDNFTSFNKTLSDTILGINSVDLTRVFAVTNMFRAFNRINKSKNIIDKFTESVKDFTETCENLMIAMGNNTDAINNIDGFNINSPFIKPNENYIEFGSNNNNIPYYNGIRIINVDEIAKTIAEKINGALSVEVPDSQVQLLINGTGGNEWTITRY